MPNLFSGGLVLADTRISLLDPKTRAVIDTLEGVQKVHVVGPSIVMGFAGSIRLGFACVRAYRHFVGIVPPKTGVEPNYMTWHWARWARWAWKHKLPDEYKNQVSHLLIMGASPRADFIPGYPFSYGFILRSPNFQLERIPPLRARSIGSGANLYVEKLDDVASDLVPLMEMDAMGPGAGVVLGHSLSKAIEDATDQSVSTHLHICSVKRTSVEIRTNDVESIPPDPALSRKMPPIARNWREYEELARERGFSGDSAFA
jgi:hypothetical protein